MKKAKIIGKITLTDKQLDKLASLGITDIALDNPKSRNDQDEILSRIGDAFHLCVLVYP